MIYMWGNSMQLTTNFILLLQIHLMSLTENEKRIHPFKFIEVCMWKERNLVQLCEGNPFFVKFPSDRTKLSTLLLDSLKHFLIHLGFSTT